MITDEGRHHVGLKIPAVAETARDEHDRAPDQFQRERLWCHNAPEPDRALSTAGRLG
jgi:hypothetical protein